MFLILASQVDETAKGLLPHFPKGSARLLTPRSLSSPGWQVHSDHPLAGDGVAGGGRFNNADIDGVLTLIPAVRPPELVQIVKEDREYVAAEMTAFLKYWLATLPCPVLNPPTGGCLAGPNWRQEQWWSAAREAGLPVGTYCRGTARPPPEAVGTDGQAEITVVGGRVVPGTDPELAEMAVRLAETTGLPLLTVTFGRQNGLGPVFLGADPIPKLSGPGLAELVVDHFTGRAGAS